MAEGDFVEWRHGGAALLLVFSPSLGLSLFPPNSYFPSQTIDVIFPLHPILLYTNPTLLAVLLEPLLRYTHSGLYPNRWPVHDLGA